ncbi:hypothetical protein RRG08_030665 [Elysia crispata]|uniref:Uncharacterized protein n=1 Tax=Elysia crispata TaxID=231223 RepID=A0AAE1CYN3_9GAST|nr:hypothetical protein RRG08_030665 [Elysia crispata]
MAATVSDCNHLACSEYNHGTHSYLAAIQLFALGSDKLEQMKKLYVITALSKCSTGGTHSLQHARTRKGYTVTWCNPLKLATFCGDESPAGLTVKVELGLPASPKKSPQVKKPQNILVALFILNTIYTLSERRRFQARTLSASRHRLLAHCNAKLRLVYSQLVTPRTPLPAANDNQPQDDWSKAPWKRNAALNYIKKLLTLR